MTFHSTEDVKERLMRSDRLSREEIEESVGHVQFLLNDALHRYFAELLVLVAGDLVSLRMVMTQNLEAIRSFDEASGRLSKRIYWLTWVLVALTLLVAVFTVLLWFRH
jgi:hypothetical protein